MTRRSQIAMCGQGHCCEVGKVPFHGSVFEVDARRTDQVGGMRCDVLDVTGQLEGGSVRRGRRQSIGRGVRGEDGATLILALAFLVIVSLIVMAMASWTQTGLGSTIRFSDAQTTNSAANSYASVALQYTREFFVSSTLNASSSTGTPTPPPPALCIPAGALSTFSLGTGQSMTAYCSTQWFPLTTHTRVVTMTVCTSATATTACLQAPLLQAVITFNDYAKTSLGDNCSPITPTSSTTYSSTSTCGTGMTINTWVFGAAPPTIASVSSAGSCSSGAVQISVIGAGFPAAGTSATVYFIPVATAASSSVTAAASTSIVSSTLVTACLPNLPSAQYYVEVTTPVGTTALNGSATWTV